MESELIVAKGSNNNSSMDSFDDDTSSTSPQSPILAGHVFFADGPIEDMTNYSTTRISDEFNDETSLDWDIRCSEETINKNLDVISNNELSLDIGDSTSWDKSAQKVMAGLSMSGFKSEKNIGNLSSLSDRPSRLMVPQSTRKIVTCTPRSCSPSTGRDEISRMNLFEAERLELEARIKVIELEQCFESLYHQDETNESKE